ncbi:MAG: hypothetical protein JNM84_20605 [Planctomycetes bacterium]|nr:hypothetical protein [Planctomycetota bacterium]
MNFAFRRRALTAIGLVAVALTPGAVGLVPRLAQEADDALARARRSRELLAGSDARLGLQMRSSYVFLGPGSAEQAVRSTLFLSGDGQLSQTLDAGLAGGAQQILGRNEAWGSRTTPNAQGEPRTESGSLDELETQVLRSRALIYEIALRFPWHGAEVELARHGAADRAETTAWTYRRSAVSALVHCDRETGLPREIAIDTAGLLVTCARWGPAPDGSRPAGAPMPRELHWTQREPIEGPSVREELLEVQFEILCPPDLLEAHRGAPPGKRIDLDPLRAEASVERWPIRLDTALSPGATFAADASGFAALLRDLRDHPAASLDPGPVRGRALAWQPSDGRFALLEPSTGPATYLARGSEGIAIQLHDPLGLSSRIGPELRGAPVPHLLWAAAEARGPEGRRFSSLRLGILR